MHRFRQRDRSAERIGAYLREHPLMGGDDGLAARAAESTQLIQLGLEDVLIGTGRDDRDLYLIFAGSVDVLIDGDVFARRRTGEVVGELELICPRVKRVATVVAREATVVGRIAEPDFSKLAEEFPNLWRALAQGVVRRLIEGRIAPRS